MPAARRASAPVDPGRVKIAHSRRPIARRYRLVSHGGTPLVSLNVSVCGTVRRGLKFGKTQITKSELSRRLLDMKTNQNKTTDAAR